MAFRNAQSQCAWAVHCRLLLEESVYEQRPHDMSTTTCTSQPQGLALCSRCHPAWASVTHQWVPARTPAVRWGPNNGEAVGGPTPTPQVAKSRCNDASTWTVQDAFTVVHSGWPDTTPQVAVVYTVGGADYKLSENDLVVSTLRGTCFSRKKWSTFVIPRRPFWILGNMFMNKCYVKCDAGQKRHGFALSAAASPDVVV